MLEPQCNGPPFVTFFLWSRVRRFRGLQSQLESSIEYILQYHAMPYNTMQYQYKQYHILQSQLESSIEYRFSTQASSIMHSSERSPMNRNAFTFNGLHLRMLHCAEQKYTTMHWKKYTTKCTEILKYI